MTTVDLSKPRLVTSREPGSEVTTRFADLPITRLEQIEYALACARTARNWLKLAGAHNAARYQARAIKSLEGAVRNEEIRLERNRQR
jgi:hypothetical protein